MGKIAHLSVATVLIVLSPLRLTDALALPADHNWSGFYVGASVGVHDINTAGVFDGTELGNPPPNLKDIGDTGPHLGVQGGYNLQISPIVFGVEGDINAGGFGKSLRTVQDGSATEAGLLNYPIEGDLNYIATLRGRLGLNIVPWAQQSVLVFLTGGMGFTDFTMNIANGRGEVGFTESGPAWGGGFELPISNRVSMKVDYLHMAFGKRIDISDATTSGVFDANDGNFVKLKDVDSLRIGFDIALGP